MGERWENDGRTMGERWENDGTTGGNGEPELHRIIAATCFYRYSLYSYYIKQGGRRISTSPSSKKIMKNRLFNIPN